MARVVLLMVVAVALVLAGCAKKADPGPTTNTTNTSTTTTGPTPDANATAPGGGSMTPHDVCTQSFDFTPGAPAVPPDPNAVQSPTQTKACPGLPAASKMTLTVTWTMSTPVFAGPSPPIVKLMSPAKSALVTCTGPNPGDPAAPKPCKADAAGAAAAGDYQLVGTGSGTVSAKAVVSVS